jgi:glycosyltransferase involved in cell wall biosynthesis
MNTSGCRLETVSNPGKHPLHPAAKRLLPTVLPVSLIVTVYNEEKSIDRLLKSILDQTVRPKEFIIVDGGSNDGTPARVEAFACEHGGWVNLIVDPVCNSRYSSSPIAQGRNVGIASAKEELIAVTDAGCVLSPTWLERIVQPLLHGSADCVGGFYEIQARTKWEQYFSVTHSPSPTDVHNWIPSSRSFAFRKSLWGKVGGYPLGCKYGEDTEFVIRLLQAGAIFTVEPQAKVVWTPTNTDRWAGGVKLEFRYREGNGERGLFLLSYLKKLVYYSTNLVAIVVGFVSFVYHLYPLLWVSVMFLLAGLVLFSLRVKRLLTKRQTRAKARYFLEFSTYLASLDIAYISGYTSGLVRRIKSALARTG